MNAVLRATQRFNRTNTNGESRHTPTSRTEASRHEAGSGRQNEWSIQSVGNPGLESSGVDLLESVTVDMVGGSRQAACRE